MINLVLGLCWLAAALCLFAYEWSTGQPVLRIRWLNISSAWFLLVLAGWNFVRWYGGRGRRGEQNRLSVAHEARLRRARQHERPTEPDPNFDFTDKPAEPPGHSAPAAPRNITDQPPSNN